MEDKIREDLISFLWNIFERNRKESSSVTFPFHLKARLVYLRIRPWINAVNSNAVTTRRLERANCVSAIRFETSITGVWSRLFENESLGGWIVPTRGSSLDGSADDARETTLGNVTTVADVITLLKCWRECVGQDNRREIESTSFLFSSNPPKNLISYCILASYVHISP